MKFDFAGSMRPAALSRWSCPRASRASHCRSGGLSSARIQRQRWRPEPHVRSAADADASTPSASSCSELSCRHFRDCSGCSLSDDLASPPVGREASAWFRSQGVEIDAPEKINAHGWRCRARLAVRLREEEEQEREEGTYAVDIGLFRAGTHAVSAIPDCVAHHPRINEAVEAIRGAVERLRTRVYSEARPARGGLRYVQLTAVSSDADVDDEDETDEGESGAGAETPVHEDVQARIQLVLVWGSDGSRQPAAKGEAERLARLLWDEKGKAPAPLFHSVFFNWQPSPGNSVMGPNFERFAGPELAWQRIAIEVGGTGEEEKRRRKGSATSTSVVVALSPAAFSQANPAAFGSLVGELAKVWSTGARAEPARIVALADLHAGAGAVGLALAAAAAAASPAAASPSSPPPSPSPPSPSPPPSPLAALERVVAVDCVGAGRVPLAASAAHLPRPKGRNGGGGTTSGRISVEFFEARAGEDPARWLAGADAAVVDPPRKGLAVGDPELLRVLCESPPRSLRRFAYISCHFPSLRRDAGELLQLSPSSAAAAAAPLGSKGEGGAGENGGGETRRRPLWRLSHGAARIFFPGADHVECLAVFERVD